MSTNLKALYNTLLNLLVIVDRGLLNIAAMSFGLKAICLSHIPELLLNKMSKSFSINLISILFNKYLDNKKVVRG